MKQPLAYSYVRFSSPEQAKGDSFRRQTEAARKYCNKHGLELADLRFHDLGISGYRGNHFTQGALGDFVEAIEQGKVRGGSYLIVESLDRLSREEVDIAFSRFASILRADIKIVTLQDGKVFSRASLKNTTDILVSILVMLRAFEESESKANRIREARDEKHRQARENKKPTGYRPPDWVRTVKDADSGKPKYELIPERAEVIKRIYHLNNSGMGAIVIARLLNEEQIPPWGRSKTGWQTSYIKKILKARTVLGEYQPHIVTNRVRKAVGEPVFGFYPAVIDPNTFKLAQMTMTARDKRSGGVRKDKVNNLFTGLAKCKHCGNTMHFVDKGKPPKGNQYLLCSLAKTGAVHNGVSCKRASIRYQETEDAILTVAATLDLKVKSSPNKGEVERLQSQLSGVHSDLGTIEEAIVRITNAIAELPNSSGLILKLAELEEHKRGKTSEYKAIEKRIDKLTLTPAASNVWNDLQQTLKLLKTEASDRSNVKLRTKINNQLLNSVDRIEFDNHAKIVFIHIDGERTLEIRFQDKMRGYVIKPSWELREQLPYTYLIKQKLKEES
ncbi:recombinase family protein [Vibrio parahaemolyticus]|uniref:recombinase family protein n=1 Tax=Vibrio parahaemolyticus TaxID=670 RepID=UPI001B81FF2A|nr:recombinase family protein [Vibrio parahaemolyticus]MDF5077847.1 recombinase family protein [Vibrio parahaemolyticus]MDF5414351.1 recombinase family protein [Vibrio parahaemolyticus]MDF5424668.1 recombinase family protein [Vibrio parahaemolyticus]HBC3864107.1 recombinase family protein [Vibrio parahaemolyticus]